MAFPAPGLVIKHVFNVRDYKVTEVIGQGAYGVVAVGYHNDDSNERSVAIKKILPFGRTLFCLRTLREIKFLKHFHHPNIVGIIDIQRPSSFDTFQEVYVVQEYMDADLHSVICTQTLTDDHIKYFLYQLLKGVKYLHSCNVIHRDLKPANLLVNENCQLKICDFGLARIDTGKPQKEDRFAFMTEYVATRWYRAPEIMLSSSEYSKAIDIWSIGCIVAEMVLSEPFLPGTDYRNQLSLIFEVLGTPTEDEIRRIKLQRAREYVRGQPQRKKIPMQKVFGRRTSNPMVIDFIDKTVRFDPSARLTIEQALEHPYVADYRDPDEETTAAPIPPKFFFFDKFKDQLQMIDLKRMLYAEIVAG